MTEEWRQIPLDKYIDNYEVSSIGRVRRVTATPANPPFYLLTPKVTNWGYHSYALSHEGRTQFFFAHRLVALAFIGSRPSRHHCVAHFDGNKTNNAVDNLRWATYAENNGSDKRRHNRVPLGDRNGSRRYPERLKRGDENGSRLYPERLKRGEQHNLSKLTAAQVSDIRRRYIPGKVSQQSLADEYGVSQQVICCVIHRKTWAHVA